MRVFLCQYTANHAKKVHSLSKQFSVKIAPLNHFFNSFNRHYLELSVPLRLLFAYALTVMVSIIDAFTGTQVSLTLVYLLPIYLCARFIKPKQTWIMVFFSTLCWLLSDLYSQGEDLVPLISLVNTIVRLATFSLFNYLLLSNIEYTRVAIKLSTIDPLTGLSNLRHFNQLASDMLSRNHRQSDRMVIASLDLDNFKSVNDTFGHAAGDEVLKMVAQTLKNSLRPSDLIARMGGDEFALILTNISAKDAALRLEEAIDVIRLSAHDLGYDIGASVGAVEVKPGDTQGLAALLAQTDALMYQVKAEGKNGLVFG